MARASEKDIETFVSVAEISADVAQRKIEEDKGRLEEAILAHFSEGDQSTLAASAPAINNDLMNRDEAIDIAFADSVPLLSTVGSLNPFALPDPTLHQNLFDGRGSYGVSGSVPHVSHPEEVQDIPIEVKGGISESVLIENVTGSASTHAPEVRETILFDDDDDDIEEEMINHAIEASKHDAENPKQEFIVFDAALRERRPREHGVDIGGQSSNSSLMQLDGEKVAEENGRQICVSSNIETSSQLQLAKGNSHNLEEVEDVVEELLVRRHSGQIASRNAEPTEYEQMVDCLLSSPQCHENSSHPQHNGEAFPGDEWGGISSEEHVEAVMLEAAMLGGLPERTGFQFSHPSTHQVPHRGSETNSSEYSRDDEYLAAVEAHREKELKAKQEVEIHRKLLEEADAIVANHKLEYKRLRKFLKTMGRQPTSDIMEESDHLLKLQEPVDKLEEKAIIQEPVDKLEEKAIIQEPVDKLEEKAIIQEPVDMLGEKTVSYQEEEVNYHWLQTIFECHFLNVADIKEMLTDTMKLLGYASDGDAVLNEAITDYLVEIGFESGDAHYFYSNQYYARIVYLKKYDYFLPGVMHKDAFDKVLRYKEKVKKQSSGSKEEETKSKSKGGKQEDENCKLPKVFGDFIEGLAGLIYKKASIEKAIKCILPRLDLPAKPADVDTHLRFLVGQGACLRMNVEKLLKSGSIMKAKVWTSMEGDRRTVMVYGTLLDVQKWLRKFIWKLETLNEATRLVIPQANVSEEGKFIERSSPMSDTERGQSAEPEELDGIIDVNGTPLEQTLEILSYLNMLLQDPKYQEILFGTPYRDDTPSENLNVINTNESSENTPATNEEPIARKRPNRVLSGSLKVQEGDTVESIEDGDAKIAKLLQEEDEWKMMKQQSCRPASPENNIYIKISEEEIANDNPLPAYYKPVVQEKMDGFLSASDTSMEYASIKEVVDEKESVKEVKDEKSPKSCSSTKSAKASDKEIKSEDEKTGGTEETLHLGAMARYAYCGEGNGGTPQ